MRFFLWLVVLAALLYGGYIAYDRWFDGDPIIVRKAPGDIFAYLKEQTSREFSVLKQKHVDEPLKNVVEEKKSGFVESAKNSAAEVITKIGESISSLSYSLRSSGTSSFSGTASSGATQAIVLTSIILRTEEEFQLRLGSQSEDVSFVIGWGDGKRDAVSLEPLKTTVVRHIFKKQGDYEVVVVSESRSGRVKNSYFVSVTP